MSRPASDGWVWLNGACRPLAAAAISPLDRGLQFGDGLFETLRAEQGRILYLPEHLQRLRASAECFRLAAADLARLPWPDLLAELLERNGLQSTSARLKILLTRGPAPELGLPPPTRPTVLVTAAPYQPPSPEAYARGWSARVLEAGFTSPLARHKTLNYLLFLAARQDALDHGQDEAILVAADGRLAETAAGSLLLHRAGIWYHPQHPQQLPGITLARTLRLLAARGHPVEGGAIAAADLPRFEAVWTLNSLVGIMPIREISGRPYPILYQDLIAEIRNDWLAGT